MRMNQINCSFCQKKFVPSRSDAKFCSSSCRYKYAHRKRLYEQALTQKDEELEKLRSQLEKLETDLINYESSKEERNIREQKIRKEKRTSDETIERLNAASDSQLFNYLVKKRKLPFSKAINVEEFYIKNQTLRSISPAQKLRLVNDYKIELREKNQLATERYKSIPLNFESIIGDSTEEEKQDAINSLMSEIAVLEKSEIKMDLPTPKLPSKKQGQNELTKKDKQARIEALRTKKSIIELNGEEIRNMKFETFTLSGELGRFLGHLDRNMVALALTGNAGAGKSYFSYQLAKLFLDNNLKVKYFSIEEGVGQLTQNKLDQYDIGRKMRVVNYASLDDIDRDAETHDVIILDSYSSVTKDPEDYEILRQTHPKTLFVVIFQKTTKNTIKGGASITFNSAAVIDVVVEKNEETGIKKRFAHMKKSRYGTTNWVYSIDEEKVISEG
ncbi:MAG: hypothetical protein GQ574_26615 [Crocinitomix sp.]|nr:hypothetical protein [Crocinitomix sp.]